MKQVCQRPCFGRNYHEQIRTLTEAGIACQILHRVARCGGIGKQNQDWPSPVVRGCMNDARKLAGADEADIEITKRSGRERMPFGNERAGR